jgi:tetratricopeptide (TPR) repeat protein/glycosyltransferase involved in cell wall biosynthesis
LDHIVILSRLGLMRRKPNVITLADSARDAGQWELAVGLYRKALGRDPRNSGVWVQYGHALKESGELRDPDKLVQAESAYRKALSLNPGVADSYLQLGHVLKLQGKTEEAKASYLRAFALDPTMPYPLQELSGLGWSEAEMAGLRSLVGSNLPPASSSALEATPKNDARRGPKALRLGSMRRKSSVIDLADRARDARQWERAAQLYRKALDRNRRNPPIWVQFGHALKESGERRDPDKLAQAEIAYRRALSLDPGTADSHLQLGHVLKLQGKTDDAQSSYLAAFALNPAMSYSLQELGGLGWSEAHIAELRMLVKPVGSDALRQEGSDGSDGAIHRDFDVVETALAQASRRTDELPSTLETVSWSSSAEAALTEALRQADSHPACQRQVHLPDLSELRGLKPRGQIAVVLHLFDPDLWSEMREAIERILHPFDLFVSLTKGASGHMRDAIIEAFPRAHVFDFEDHGRDLGPFLVFLQSGVLFQYDLVCKLHTKRSPHIRETGGWRYPDGDTWRRALIGGILGSSSLVDQIVASLLTDPHLGMVVADGNIFRGHEHWVNNEKLLAELLPRLGISPDVRDRSFPGGSIFWIRSSLLHPLAGLGLRLDDFDPEPLVDDGGLGHAVERMFGLICERAGMRVVEHGRLGQAVQQGTGLKTRPVTTDLPERSDSEETSGAPHKIEAIDALHALVLGRFPESDHVRRENIGRPLIEVADIFIASAEFRTQVLDAFRWNGKLPHEILSPEDQRRVIEIARETGFQTIGQDTAQRGWEAVLYAVFGSGIGYEKLHRHYGPAAGYFVTMLKRVADKANLPEDFDPFLYLKANPDVAAAGADPVEHFLGRAHLENRRLRPNFRPLPDDFDPEEFLDTRPSKALRPSFPLDDSTLPWPMHTFHYRHCDHDKLCRNRAIISYLYLKGSGVEVKALNAPFPKRRDSKVLYLDSITGDHLRERFPHLSGLAVVKPDILDDETTLQKVIDGSKDFVNLAGALPFFENPILAVQNACRVVEPGGTILISVPDKRFSIDVRRPVTDLDHFWRDYQSGPEISRREHYEEFVANILNGSPADPWLHPDRLIEAQYPIHFHVWTHHSFVLFIEDVAERLPLDCEIELFCRNEIESICVLRKSATEHSRWGGDQVQPVTAGTPLFRSEVPSAPGSDGPKEKDELPPTASSLPVQSSAVGLRLVYVSGEPDTPGHQYRVARSMAAAEALGACASWMRVEEIPERISEISAAAVLFIWRVPWDERLASAVEAARLASAKIVFDVDDLMVDPELARLDVIDGIRSQGYTEETTRAHYARVRQTMSIADLCVATTEELAGHMRHAWMPAVVVPNGFDRTSLAVSRLAVRRRRRAGSGDGVVRIGYAGGSRTHQRDFALCAEAVAEVLRARPDFRLVAFRSADGSVAILDIEEFPRLRGLENQVEWRNFVPPERLAEEIARFDINLAPLEVGNPFCEAKSELKYFEAALVDVPTIASPTGPFRRAIRHGETGFLAATPDEWRNALERLADDAALRHRIGSAAYRDVLWTFGPERRLDAISTLLDLLAGGRTATRAFELELLRRRRVAAPSAVQVPDHDVVFEEDKLGVAEVTVVVPLYNYARYVTDALNSVRNQTMPALDLVVVDDRSTDDSLEVVVKWAKENTLRFNRISVLQNRANSGLALTRNVGFSSAETPFVMPLDADNRLLPDCVNACLEIMHSNGAAFVYPYIRQFGAADGIMGAVYDPVRLANGNFIDAMALVSRAAWAAVGGYHPLRPMGWEDFDFWCSLAERGLGGVLVPGVPLAEYLVHANSMIETAKARPDVICQMMDEMERRHPWLTQVWPLSGTRNGQDGASPTGSISAKADGRLVRLLPILRCPETGGRLRLASEGDALISEDGARRWPLFLGRALLFPGMTRPQVNSDTHLSNAMPASALALIRSAQGQVLHLSAGGTTERFEHVVEVEAAVFRHTDVIADSHNLPFADGVFEAVIALNAFEHYQDPSRAAQEILRVLRPGGRVLIRTAFLQPLHEAPWHFYNCTRYGLETWFKDFETETLHVSSNFHAGYSLAWLASECEAALRNRLSASAADSFAAAPVGRFVSLWRTAESARNSDPLWDDLAALPQDAQEGVAAGFEFLGRRPPS